MTDTDGLRNEVKLEIQALLCTEKEAIPSKRLYGLYISEMGTPMPYAKLGYKQMDDFLRSIPDVVYSYTNHMDGMLYVKAVPLKVSSHINELVHGQRAPKKKKIGSNYSMTSRFKSFRVSSQVAPHRNFNSNYSPYKPPGRNGSFTRPPPILVGNYHYNFPPRFMKINQQPPTSAPPMRKPNPLPPPIYSQRTTIGSTMFSNSQNINNNKTFIKPNIMEPKPVAVPVSSHSNVTVANKPQGLPGRAHLTPQLMEPRTPAPPRDVPIEIPVEKPSGIVDPVQNSLKNLKISSSKPVDQVNPLERDSKDQMLSRPKGLSPIKIHQEDTVFQWRPVETKPIQEISKPTQTFYPSGFVQRPAVSRRVVIKSEDMFPKAPESDPVKPNFQKIELKNPEEEKKEEERPRAPEADSMKPNMHKTEFKDPVPSAPRISPVARAPRVLLRNCVPVVSPPPPIQTPRPFVYLPDRLPPVAPSPAPSPASPFISRRLPFKSESVANPVNVKPTAVPSTSSNEFFCERLKKMVEQYNLGRVSLNHNQLKSGRYIACIKVGQEMFMTYPEDFEYMTEAYEEAAKQAVEHFESTPTWMIPA